MYVDSFLLLHISFINVTALLKEGRVLYISYQYVLGKLFFFFFWSSFEIIMLLISNIWYFFVCKNTWLLKFDKPVWCFIIMFALSCKGCCFFSVRLTINKPSSKNHQVKKRGKKIYLFSHDWASLSYKWLAPVFFRFFFPFWKNMPA